jgi:hypothetical protein
MRLACIWSARRVRNDSFSSTFVQKTERWGEEHTISLVQRGLTGGFLGRLGMAWHDFPLAI